MSQEELDIIKHKIDSSISEIINNLNLTIENDDYAISKNDFQKFKEKLYSKLRAINDKCSYQYYMDNTYKFIAHQYNIKIHILQDHELITRYILPFTLTIKEEDKINEKEICNKLIDLDWSLPELVYEINEAHNLDMQKEFRESLHTLTDKELDYLLNVDFDTRKFINTYVKELYQIDLDNINHTSLVPEAVKCAIKEAINDDYPIEVACADWSRNTDYYRCYDYIMINYLNNDWEDKPKKLTSIYIYALLAKL